MRQLRHRSYEQVVVWLAAATVGLAAVSYAKLISWFQSFYFSWFNAHPYLVSLSSIGCFVLATALVRKLAPDAKGSGIPQVLEAIELTKDSSGADRAWKSDLISLKTAVVKVASSVVGILGGASIGREGPTVQIAASGFAWVGARAKRWVPSIDLRSYLVAGAAAGVAAAFNTPLAGVTFAIEEIAEGAFGPFRQTVMLAVIISGITVQGLLGDYLYFGHPKLEHLNLLLVPQALLLGVAGGIFGGAFAKLLGFPRLTRLPTYWWPRALVCGVLCTLIGLMKHGDTAGTGYEITQKALSLGSLDQVDLLFPFWKLVTTVLSYLSGMAGGIFAPSLSIGAGMGISVAKIVHFTNFKACALMGMVAFFSGVVQAPFTAVIIVMEMTDEHILVLPFMISAFLAQAIGKWIMPVPLYRLLATRRVEG